MIRASNATSLSLFRAGSRQKATGGKPKAKPKPLPKYSPGAERLLRAYVTDCMMLMRADHSDRPTPHGQLVATFVLPLELAVHQQNRMQYAKPWQHTVLNRAVYNWMWPQASEQIRRDKRKVLPGRPWLWCLRLSSGKTDPRADWAKVCIDRLIVPTKRAPKYRLGLIQDDDEEHLDLHVTREPAARGKGVVYMELRSGVPI